MNNAIKVGFLLEADMPVSTMVYHKDVVCTLHKHTLDLMFSLPAIQEHLLPIILEYDMKIPVTVFSDQNTQEWVKESDVMRHHQEFYGSGSHEFAYLLDDIEDTKMKLFKLIPIKEKVNLEDVKAEYKLLREELNSIISNEIIANSAHVPVSENLSLSLSIMGNKSISLHNKHSSYSDLFGIDTRIGASVFNGYIEDIKNTIELYKEAATRKGLIMQNRLFLENYDGLDGLRPSYDGKSIFKDNFEFVYIFKCGEKFIKIGVSSNPYRRLSDFNDVFGLQIESFYLCLKSDRVEPICHRHMISYHMSGEFFNFNGIDKAKEFLRHKCIIEFNSAGDPSRCDKLNGTIPFKDFRELCNKFIKNKKSSNKKSKTLVLFNPN